MQGFLYRGANKNHIWLVLWWGGVILPPLHVHWDWDYCMVEGYFIGKKVSKGGTRFIIWWGSFAHRYGARDKGTY